VVRATFDAIDRLMTTGQVRRLRGVDVDAPEEVEATPVAETEAAGEETVEAAATEGDDS
jgi:hypothetical protein